MTRAAIKPRKTARGWVLPAPAKLNFYLQVHGRRDDGFHELTTLIAPLRLCDTIVVSATDVATAEIKLRVTPALAPRGDASPEHSPVPSDERNLIVRALRRLREAAGVTRGATVTLIKRIPSLAGMGGGSSDAAAALRAGEAAWGVSLGQRKLHELASEIGSDVPVLLSGEPSVCRGRGEKIEPVHLPAGIPCVVVQPPAALGAGQVYQSLDVTSLPRCSPEGLSELVFALRRGELAAAGRLMLNHLQSPAERLAPAVAAVAQAFTRAGVLAHQMTGSGAAYFGLCQSLRQARCVAAKLRQQGLGWVNVTTTMGSSASYS